VAAPKAGYQRYTFERGDAAGASGEERLKFKTDLLERMAEATAPNPLQQILDRLDRIEKRLDELEKK
jgi:hypothetical protein